MEFNLFFNWFILTLIGVFGFFNIKTYTEIRRINKIAKQKYSRLESDFAYEEKKHEINSQKIILLDELSKNLFNRLFKITRDILLMQKIIINNHLQ